jgi:hypothetical protein
MRHLDAAELVDLAEGADRGAQNQHLAECVECRRHVEELVATLSAAREADVPEPSPLFWDHLSARVHERVAAEPPARPRWIDRWIPQVPGFTRGGLGIAVLTAACAALLVAVILPSMKTAQPASSGVSTSTAASPQPQITTTEPALPVAATNERLSLADDPELSLMANLAEDVDLDDAAAEGLTTHDVAVDQAITELTADERAELQRLLTQELTRTGA